MLPVPWIGTGTQEATHSANPGRGQEILRGAYTGHTPFGGGGQRCMGGGRDPCLPPERRKNASPVGTGWPVVPGLWPEQSHKAPQPPRPCTALPPHPGGLAQAGSHREALPPSCSRSAIALISENLQECSGDGITWNCSFLGKTKHTKFSVSGIGLGGAAVCWGGFFFSCYFVWVSFLFFNNVYNLPQSLCLL